MSRLVWRTLATLLVLLARIPCAGDDQPSASTFRLVHVHVLRPDGKPAAHREVLLRGFDRTNMEIATFTPPLGSTLKPDLARARKDGCVQTTDADGNATFRIGNFAGWRDKAGQPGWGIYALQVDPGPDDAGGVSQRFCCAENDQFDDQPSDWGATLLLPAGGLQLSMSIQPGYKLVGHVVDDRDHRTPAPKVEVWSWNDLNVDTHTGEGGQIFPHHAVTDDHGNFTLTHVYHAKLHLSFNDHGSGTLWMTTHHNGQWVRQDTEVVDPPPNESLQLECGVIVHPQFHYTGAITDANGKPVTGAKVTAGISYDPEPDTYGDEHTFENATTDAQGHYDLVASSPWCRFIDAEDALHGRVDTNEFDATPLMPPGKYDLQFPAKPAPPR
jgi:hypothetical protein